MTNAQRVGRIEHRLGTDGVYTVTCYDSDGVVVDVSAGSVAAELYDVPGGTKLISSWATGPSGASSGVVTITIADDEANLATATAGTYALVITHTDGSGGKTVYPLRGFIEFLLLPDVTT